MLDLTTLYITQRKQYVCWSNQSSHKVGTQLGFVDEFRYLGHVLTADCRDDKDIKKIRRQNAVGMHAGQEVLICTYGAQNPIVQIVLLPHLWMCSLASFIPELY